MLQRDAGPHRAVHVVECRGPYLVPSVGLLGAVIATASTIARFVIMGPSGAKGARSDESPGSGGSSGS